LGMLWRVQSDWHWSTFGCCCTIILIVWRESSGIFWCCIRRKWNQARSDFFYLHHDEPRVRRSNRTSRFPVSSLPRSCDDDPRFRKYRWNYALFPRVQVGSCFGQKVDSHIQIGERVAFLLIPLWFWDESN
jgi:hypothetical protein